MEWGRGSTLGTAVLMPMVIFAGFFRVFCGSLAVVCTVRVQRKCGIPYTALIITLILSFILLTL